MLGMTEITIPSGSSIPTSPGTNCVTVSALQDELVEGDHDFEIEITSTDLDAVVPGTQSINTVTITDEDGMFVTFCRFNINFATPCSL